MDPKIGSWVLVETCEEDGVGSLEVWIGAEERGMHVEKGKGLWEVGKVCGLEESVVREVSGKGWRGLSAPEGLEKIF